MNSGDTTLQAQWCVDSETGEDVLICSVSGLVIARRVDGVIIDHTKGA